MIKKSISLESQIRDDWHYLKKIKSKDITKYMCDVAFSIDYEAIKYIPNRYKEEYSAYVMKQNWLLYNYCDIQSLTIDDWKDVLSKINLNYIDLKKSEKDIFERIATHLANTYEYNEISTFFIFSSFP